MAKRIPRKALSAPELDTLDDELQALRIAYERYFLGIDRTPPERARTQIERQVRRLSLGAMGSTALRFRLDGLRSRFVTYSQHWRRVCRQIEEGTYVRIVAEADRRRRLAAFQARVDREKAKAQQEAQAREEAEAAREAKQGKRPIQSENEPEAAPASANTLGPPPIASRKKRAPAIARGSDVPNGRALYERYVQAKKQAGQSTDGLSYSAMMQQIARQIPKIKAQHGGSVRFEVANKNGRVKLVAKVDKSG